MKPGWQTTEFWVQVVGLVVIAGQSFTDSITTGDSLAVAIVTAGYAVARAITKAKQSTAG